ncbi:MAG: NAD(+) diphosphatase [Chloroflexi bacterium]|nr:NAD(+) diphosphatase [Chloroflexota bacterium]
MKQPHVFAGNPLDRGDQQRRDEEWLQAQSQSPNSRFLPLRNLDILLDRRSDIRLGWIDAAEVRRLNITAAPLFLGISDGVSRFAIDVSELNDQAAGELVPNETRWFEEARDAAMALSLAEAGIVAQARMQIDWHARHRFCGVCGEQTHIARGGQMRLCPSCNSNHFPRTDPVIIVVVGHGDDCLLGQSRGRLSRLGWYSALAGFVDQAESIEEAVRREVREESGIEVGDVQYHSSQPWPFPSSLMIGCHAQALTTEIHHDEEEMADVRWWNRADALSALQGRHPDLKLPGPIAIAHHLIKSWAENPTAD